MQKEVDRFKAYEKFFDLMESVYKLHHQVKDLKVEKEKKQQVLDKLLTQEQQIIQEGQMKLEHKNKLKKIVYKTKLQLF